MVDAIAAAAELPVATVRRAAMYSKSLGAVAATSRCAKGAAGSGEISARAVLARRRQCWRKRPPMWPRRCRRSDGAAAFEWKMDGARIQVHKVGGRRAHLHAQPERGHGGHAGNRRARARLRRTHPGARRRGDCFRRGGRGRIPSRSPCGASAASSTSKLCAATLPIGAFFFDCLRFGAQSIADRPARERFVALTRGCSASHAGSTARHRFRTRSARLL